MGWTGTQWYGSGTRKDFLISRFTEQHGEFSWWISDVSMRGAVCYCINWQENKRTGERKHEGMVILTEKRKNDPHYLYYKNMGESVLPYYFDAPVSLINKLNQLGEPCNDNARQWRDRCLENAQRAKIKIELGTVIEFLKPMKFTGRLGDFEESKFTVADWMGKKIFRTQDGRMCRIPNWKKLEYRVLGVQS